MCMQSETWCKSQLVWGSVLVSPFHRLLPFPLPQQLQLQQLQLQGGGQDPEGKQEGEKGKQEEKGKGGQPKKGNSRTKKAKDVSQQTALEKGAYVGNCLFCVLFCCLACCVFMLLGSCIVNICRKGPRPVRHEEKDRS